MIYVLDTHPLVWFLADSERLGPTAKSIFSDAEAEFIIPAIVLAEIKYLHAKKRFSIDVDTVYERVISARNCTIFPVDENVISALPTSLDIHDALIVGTALVIEDALDKDVAVITRDEMIVDSDLIMTVW